MSYHDRIARSLPRCSLALLVLTSGGCIRVDAFECDDNDACVRDGARGRCEPERVCSYEDDACEGGWRYSPNAGALADVCVAASDATEAECPESTGCEACGAIEVGARVFTVCEQPLAWPDARDECARRSMTLASVHDTDEQASLASAVPFPSVAWIGLHDRDAEDEYAWDDGSAFDFAAWRPGEPDDADGEEDCVALGEEGWSAWRCEIVHPFICVGL